MEMTLEKIHIVYAADNGYAPWLGVSLASILVNSEVDEELCVYIVDGGISVENREKIALLQKIKSFSLLYLEVDEKQLINCCVRDSYSIAGIYRLLLSELLPALEKVIYLDCDVIARCSLAELWAYDVAGVYMGVVPDLIDYLPFSSRKYKRLLKMQDNFCYFNAGVLVLNLKKIRSDGVFQQAISWLGEHGEKAIYCDQDALNVVFSGKAIRWLHPRWNVQAPMYWPGARRVLNRSDKMVAALSDPAIVHFTTEEKPWKQNCFCEWKSLFIYYRLQTPWCDASMSEPYKTKVTVVVMFLKRWVKLRFFWLGGIFMSWFSR